MVIQHNMSALNADRMLNITSGSLTGSAEKLASGYKINRAADDAAGLSISEKMRKKIRGLEKGMENVQDGISLCQVADGALNEVADMLQRARELSIQAYNGTNSKSDRQTIQEEISQCIEELDRVFDTTKFNEIYIFRNGQRVQGDVFHSEAYTYIGTRRSMKDMPSWLKINNAAVVNGQGPKIEQHSGNGYQTLQNTSQITNEIMKQSFKLNDGSYAKVYYGSRLSQGTTADGYQWAGDFIKNAGTAAYVELMAPGHAFYDYITKHLDANGSYTGWTASLADNPSAKVDFGEIAKVTDASELYHKLSELVGVEMGFPCGTCNKMEAVRFGGEYYGVNNLKFYDQGQYIATHTINLSEKSFAHDGKTYSGYFQAVAEVMAIEDSDPDKQKKTTALAEAIAEDIVQTTYNSLNGVMTTHYDRVFRGTQNDDRYSIYVYDYRDADSLANSDGNALIRTSAMVSYNYEETVQGGYYTHYDRWEDNQIWIQASDEAGDGIPIHSKHLSAEVLKLQDYRVDTYTSEVILEDYAEYQKRLAAWEAKVPEPKEERYTQKVSVRYEKKAPVYETISPDGEPKVVLKSPGEYEWKEEEREFVRYIYDESAAGPRPVRGATVHEKYDPSELQLLDDAIATVNAVRSYYGAVQNRLEHTYNNNYNADENITYAESRIRDTDMADEVVRNSLLNILQQAGLSMLSQANQTNQGVNMLLS